MNIRPYHSYEIGMAYVPERILECSICLERLKDPRSLTCSHIFCQKCITDWLTTSNGCPICLKPAKLEDLKQLYLLDDILDNFNKLTCVNCNKVVDELKECDHCSKNVCVSCAIEHSKEATAETREASTECTNASPPPGLEELNEKVGNLMSEAAAAKENLTTQMRKFQEALIGHIGAVTSKELDKMEKTLSISEAALNAQIKNVDSLITETGNRISKSIIKSLRI
ncbi:hypothetical protein Aperf_G00000022951 [Anoplocephala perfoliata]